jgi:hypothetical protein
VVARYDSDPRIVGVLFAAFGVGAVLGNVVAYRLVKRVQGLTLIARVAVAQALPLWLLVAELPAWGAVAALLASGLANGLINPSLRDRHPADSAGDACDGNDEPDDAVLASDAGRTPRRRPAPRRLGRRTCLRVVRRDSDSRDGGGRPSRDSR